MRKLIIDADTGSDDAVALVMAIRNLPKESILGITIAAGNVPLKQGISNALYVNELCDTNINVYAGESAPMYRPYIELDNMEQATAHALSEDPASSSAQYVHGADGLGDIGLEPKNTNYSDVSALDFYRETLKKNTDIEIVALGPLSNIARLIKEEPKLLGSIKHCYIMGGCSNGVGNITKTAEYNFWVDPEAADIVLKSEIPITVIGWDPSYLDGTLNLERVNEIDLINTKYSKFTNDIFGRVRNLVLEVMGQESYSLPDPLAMSVFLDEEIITESIFANMVVDTRDGPTRGACIIDFMDIEMNQRKVRIVQRCNNQKFFELLKKSLIE
jgi:purine nucleosidase